MVVSFFIEHSDFCNIILKIIFHLSIDKLFSKHSYFFFFKKHTQNYWTNI